MQSEMLIAPIFFLSFFGMIFGIVYLRNKENMAMIDRGINPRNRKISPRPFLSLKLGLMLCGVGTGLFLAFLADEFMVNHKAVSLAGKAIYREFPQIYVGLISLFGGLGLILSYRIEKKDWLDKEIDQKTIA